MAASDEMQAAILRAVAAIPAGVIHGYGEVANNAGYPGYARYVGRVLKQLPPGSKIPWHRVTRADGRSAFPLGSDAQRRQRERLEAEGFTCRNGRFIPPESD